LLPDAFAETAERCEASFVEAVSRSPKLSPAATQHRGDRVRVCFFVRCRGIRRCITGESLPKLERRRMFAPIEPVSRIAMSAETSQLLHWWVPGTSDRSFLRGTRDD
jgi:hypothetical protein